MGWKDFDIFTGWRDLAVKLNKVLDYEEFESFDLHWQWTLIPHAVLVCLWNVSSMPNSFLYGANLTFFSLWFFSESS